jgi:hypothetical protein
MGNKNLVVILITIFLIFGIIFYIFFSSVIKKYLRYDDKADINIKSSDTDEFESDPDSKRVRFNDKVEYNIYSNPTDTTTIAAKDNYLQTQLPSKNFKSGNGYKISTGSVGSVGSVGSMGSTISDTCTTTPFNYHSPIEDTPYGPYFAGVQPVDTMTISEQGYDISDNLPLVISPYEHNHETGNLSTLADQSSNGMQSWADSYAAKVINQDDQNKYMGKIKRSHESYGKSMCQFYKYQTNREVKMIKDPVASIYEANPNDPRLSGMKIKDIYDKQIPKFEDTQKKIDSIMPGIINYSGESDMNGALLNGSTIHGYDLMLDVNQFDTLKK